MNEVTKAEFDDLCRRVSALETLGVQTATKTDIKKVDDKLEGIKGDIMMMKVGVDTLVIDRKEEMNLLGDSIRQAAGVERRVEKLEKDIIAKLDLLLALEEQRKAGGNGGQNNG